VVYDLYASAEEMQAKMLAGAPAMTWCCNPAWACRARSRRGLQKIDKAKLTGWATLTPKS
jgi:putrescine transport system substrate-binding protein